MATSSKLLSVIEGILYSQHKIPKKHLPAGKIYYIQNYYTRYVKNRKRRQRRHEAGRRLV
jgi:hypothetical protein